MKEEEHLQKILNGSEKTSSDVKERSGLQCPMQVATEHWLPQASVWGNNQVLAGNGSTIMPWWPWIFPHKLCRLQSDQSWQYVVPFFIEQGVISLVRSRQKSFLSPSCRRLLHGCLLSISLASVEHTTFILTLPYSCRYSSRLLCKSIKLLGCSLELARLQQSGSPLIQLVIWPLWFGAILWYKGCREPTLCHLLLLSDSIWAHCSFFFFFTSWSYGGMWQAKLTGVVVIFVALLATVLLLWECLTAWHFSSPTKNQIFSSSEMKISAGLKHPFLFWAWCG